MKALFSFLFLILSSTILAQPSTVSIIEVYGNRKLEEKEIRSKLGVNTGDSIEKLMLQKEEITTRLREIPGVKKAAINFVCCDDKYGQWMMFAGISESDSAAFTYNKPPVAAVFLPQEITGAYEAFSDAFMAAVQKGNGDEDRSQGYSLMKDPATRIQQEKFLVCAKKYFSTLKKVLHTAADRSQRAIAAFVIAYAPDKNQVAKELMWAIHDTDDETRNNATRGLAVLLQAAQTKPQLLQTKIPAGPFIAMINSVVWTDRNKGLAVLSPLTESRDPAVLDALRKNALPSLFEMAAWTNPGHAYYAYMITGRIAGFSDKEISSAFYSDERKTFLQKMTGIINHTQ